MVNQTFARREYKYLLTSDQYRNLSRYFELRGLVPDKFSQKSQNRSYYVASLYLDTPDYLAYWEKMYGLKDRTKFRLRTYWRRALASNPVYWEIKRRNGDFFNKTRQPIPWVKTRLWLAGRLKLSQLPQAVKFYEAEMRLRLKPSLLVTYQREPWLDPVQPDLRLTFDYQIQAMPTDNLFDQNRLADVYPNQYILEIKFSGSVPGYVAEFCRVAGLAREPLSKYCRGLEACGIVREENL